MSLLESNEEKENERKELKILTQYKLLIRGSSIISKNKT